MATPLKKIQDLVYKGMVLDDKGGWIPLADKLRKEKKFLQHLEKGEILADGVWTRLADIPQLTTALDETRDVRHQAPLPPPATRAPKSAVLDIPVPEETVSFSNETLRDVTLPVKTAEPPPEEDFAPETKVFSIIRTQDTPLSTLTEKPPAAGDTDQLVTGETQAYFIPGGQTSPPVARKVGAHPEPEYQETMLYNTKMLKRPVPAQPDPEARSTNLVFSKTAMVSHAVTSDEDEHLLRKRTPPFWMIVLIGVGGIAALAVVWLLL